jgi:hypothetical protein
MTPAAIRPPSRLARYAAWLERERGLHFADHDALWRWSVTDLDASWRSIWDHFDVGRARRDGRARGAGFRAARAGDRGAGRGTGIQPPARLTIRAGGNAPD